MSQPRIAVFARLANGNAEPVRIIEGQATKMSRSMHGIVYDEVNDEIGVANPFAQALLFFRGDANGNESPIRVLQGPGTYLYKPQNLHVDTVNNEVYVPQREAVLVFRRDATGNAAPIRILRGPKTQIKGGTRVAVDPAIDMLVVVDRSDPPAVLFFNRTDEGNVAPKGKIAGPRTGLTVRSTPTLYPPRKEIIIAVFDNPANFRAGGNPEQPGFIGVWKYSDRGDVPPRAVIRGPASRLIRPREVALNPEANEIYVVDMYRNSLFTFLFPEIY